MGLAISIPMVVRRGFSIWVVCLLSLLTACGGAYEDASWVAPSLTDEDPDRGDPRDGTLIGSPINDPGSKERIMLRHNGIAVSSGLLVFANPQSVFDCGAGVHPDISATQFIIDQGPTFETLTLNQDRLTWKDLGVLQGAFTIQCLAFINIQGVYQWVPSDTVRVSLSKALGPVTKDAPEVVAPPLPESF